MTERPRILAKDTGETLSEHTIRCLKIAENVIANLPFEENVVDSIRADLLDAIAVHDVGKAAVGFQKSLEEGGKRWGHRHEVISAAFASFQKLREEVVFAVLTHHRAIPADMACSCKGCLGFEELPLSPEPYPVWFQLAKEWEQNKPALLNEWHRILSTVRSNKLSSLVGLDCLSLGDGWLDRGKQSRKIDFEKRLYASLLRGLLMSCDHIGSSNVRFVVPKVPDLSNINLAVPSLFNFQKKAGEIKGNLILQAPTGSGKTLAALLWVGKNQKRNGRLFYALPNTASINAMYLRLCNDYFGRHNVGLLHSRAVSSLYSIWEKEEDSPFVRQKEALMAKSLARELWYPIRVCTPHQILRYTLHGKGWELMLSEFPNACFVFDEIHAYDPIVTGFVIATAKLVSELNASCLFLSATMPEFLKYMIASEVAQTEFLTPSFNDALDRHILEKKRHILQIKDGNILTNIDSVLNAVNDSRSTLIVCNHVPSAQTVFNEIRNRGVGDVLLLHSRFCRRDRDRIEKAIQSRLPKVLVATQVVEVSLDVDFEQGFFEPAPIDATIQRLGRINRNGDRPPVDVVVLREQLGKYPIYNKETVKKSLQELQRLSNPLRETDLVEAANRVYGGGYFGEDLQKYNDALNHSLFKRFKERLVAGSHNDWTEEVIDKSDGTVDLLPCSLKEQYRELLSSGLWLGADRLLVPVRTVSLHYLDEFVDRSFDPWIIKKPYSPTLGLSLNLVNSAE